MSSFQFIPHDDLDNMLTLKMFIHVDCYRCIENVICEVVYFSRCQSTDLREIIKTLGQSRCWKLCHGLQLECLFI